MILQVTAEYQQMLSTMYVFMCIIVALFGLLLLILKNYFVTKSEFKELEVQHYSEKEKNGTNHNSVTNALNILKNDVIHLEKTLITSQKTESDRVIAEVGHLNGNVKQYNQNASNLHIQMGKIEERLMKLEK